MIARRAMLAAGLLATCPAQAQTRSQRVTQYKAGDQLLMLDGASQPRRLTLPDDAAVASHQAVDVSPLWDRSFDLGDV